MGEMTVVEVSESTKNRLVRLAGASSIDETIRCLLEKSSKPEGHEIARKHRDEWVEKFVQAAHSDDLEAMKVTAQIVIALTECYWELFHKGV